jgi:hypothetical protein
MTDILLTLYNLFYKFLFILINFVYYFDLLLLAYVYDFWIYCAFAKGLWRWRLYLYLFWWYRLFCSYFPFMRRRALREQLKLFIALYVNYLFEILHTMAENYLIWQIFIILSLLSQRSYIEEQDGCQPFEKPVVIIPRSLFLWI